jgi:hypothetical protein
MSRKSLPQMFIELSVEAVKLRRGMSVDKCRFLCRRRAFIAALGPDPDEVIRVAIIETADMLEARGAADAAIGHPDIDREMWRTMMVQDATRLGLTEPRATIASISSTSSWPGRTRTHKDAARRRLPHQSCLQRRQRRNCSAALPHFSHRLRTKPHLHVGTVDGGLSPDSCRLGRIR